MSGTVFGLCVWWLCVVAVCGRRYGFWFAVFGLCVCVVAVCGELYGFWVVCVVGCVCGGCVWYAVCGTVFGLCVVAVCGMRYGFWVVCV